MEKVSDSDKALEMFHKYLREDKQFRITLLKADPLKIQSEFETTYSVARLVASKINGTLVEGGAFFMFDKKNKNENEDE